MLNKLAEWIESLFFASTLTGYIYPNYMCKVTTDEVVMQC